MRKYIDLRVEANETDLADFVKIMGVIQYLCAIGASREVRIKVDGDGSADFTFHVNGEKIPHTEVETGYRGKEFFNFYLGE